MQTHSLSTNPIGFHYYPDSAHYTNKDLNTVLAHLEKLHASWLVLHAETSRAIPETFISGLLARNITPVLYFPFSLPNSPAADDLKAILNAYFSWGVKYVILFDRPNDRESWSASGWSQINLVESFLDRFVPLANACLTAGLTPVFPALTPGGSYWDLSFFSLALQGLQRRGQKALLNKLALAAYACTYNHPLDWGKGGFANWPQNKPYSTAAQSQDQIGFNQYEWLEGIAARLLGKTLPVILLGLGRKDLTATNYYSPEDHGNIVRQIKSFLNSTVEPKTDQALLLSGNFWLLEDIHTDDNYPMAWVKEDSTTLPAYSILAQEETTKSTLSALNQQEKKSNPPQNLQHNHPISHYLLLPKYEWGIADWHLEAIKPFVLKHQPTIGFSLEEAALANQVTVVGGEESFSEDALALLRAAGCQVERISGDGTSIATQLTER